MLMTAVDFQHEVYMARKRKLGTVIEPSAPVDSDDPAQHRESEVSAGVREF